MYIVNQLSNNRDPRRRGRKQGIMQRPSDMAYEFSTQVASNARMANPVKYFVNKPKYVATIKEINEEKLPNGINRVVIEFIDGSKTAPYYLGASQSIFETANETV